MGTNYYHGVPPCSKCGHGVDIHIGKASHGWTFSFHGTDTIRSWKDWEFQHWMGNTDPALFVAVRIVSGLTTRAMGCGFVTNAAPETDSNLSRR